MLVICNYNTSTNQNSFFNFLYYVLTFYEIFLSLKTLLLDSTKEVGVLDKTNLRHVFIAESAEAIFRYSFCILFLKMLSEFSDLITFSINFHIFASNYRSYTILWELLRCVPLLKL